MVLSLCLVLLLSVLLNLLTLIMNVCVSMRVLMVRCIGSGRLDGLGVCGIELCVCAVTGVV